MQGWQWRWLLRGLMAVAFAGTAGLVASAAGQPVTCEPWVSHAFNNAVADQVNRERPKLVPNAQETKVGPAPPCGSLATAFTTVDEYIADPTTENRDERSRQVRVRALRARLNEIVVVRVQHLQTLWDRANCIDRVKSDQAARASGSAAPAIKLTNCAPRDILLYLDGRPIEGLKPESGAPDVERQSGTLRYHLMRTEQSKEHWADLLGLDLQRTAKFNRYVRLSVGLAGGEPIPTAVTSFELVRIRSWWLFTWLVFAGICLFVFYRWASTTDLLRDRQGLAMAGVPRPYSLALCQGAWWTILTLFAVVFIWLVTGQRDFSGSALTLLGITGATAIGARIIDSSRRPTVAGVRDEAREMEIRAALDEHRRLERAVAEAKPESLAYQEAVKNYRAFVDDVRLRLPGVFAQESEGLLRDVLSDETGVSFHRFQMAAWALILGVMFALEVLERLAMPEFDANLLALLGISSGTYLGLKIPEKG